MADGDPAEESQREIVDYLVKAFVKEYVIALVAVVMIFIIICLVICFVRRYNIRKRKNRDYLTALDGDLNVEKGPNEAAVNMTLSTPEGQNEAAVKKRLPTPEDNVKGRRTQANTRSIIDMLDTVEWLRKTLQEGGMSSNDAAMLEVKALLRRLRQLKYAYPSEDESDYELTSIMPITPTRKNIPADIFQTVALATTKKYGPNEAAVKKRLPTPEDSEDRKMKEILEIKDTLEGLTEKVSSLRNSLRLRNNESFRNKNGPLYTGMNVSFSRQPSSFSSSSLVCYEPSPTIESQFEMPPPTTNNLARQTSISQAVAKTVPSPPKRVDSFKHAGYSNDVPRVFSDWRYADLQKPTPAESDPPKFDNAHLNTTTETKNPKPLTGLSDVPRVFSDWRYPDLPKPTPVESDPSKFGNAHLNTTTETKNPKPLTGLSDVPRVFSDWKYPDLQKPTPVESDPPKFDNAHRNTTTETKNPKPLTGLSDLTTFNPAPKISLPAESIHTAALSSSKYSDKSPTLEEFDELGEQIKKLLDWGGSEDVFKM